MVLLADLPNFLDPGVITALLTLTVLEIILGVDNIIFISIVSNKLPESQQPKARTIGLLLAMVFRIALLFAITWIIQLTNPLFTIGFIKNEGQPLGISWKDIILMTGGIFLIIKSTLEIHHKLEIARAPNLKVAPSKFMAVILQIVMVEKTKKDERGQEHNHDTIGMIAMDAAGQLSGACTTSGMAFKMRGRVGDSPIIGAGLYVDNEVGAATSTGVGEEVVRICGSHTVTELMRQGLKPEQACKKAVERIIRMRGEKVKDLQIGFIALNKKGEYGGYAMQKGFTYVVQTKVGSKVFDAKSLF